MIHFISINRLEKSEKEKNMCAKPAAFIVQWIMEMNSSFYCARESTALQARVATLLRERERCGKYAEKYVIHATSKYHIKFYSWFSSDECDNYCWQLDDIKRSFVLLFALLFCKWTARTTMHRWRIDRIRVATYGSNRTYLAFSAQTTEELIAFEFGFLFWHHAGHF